MRQQKKILLRFRMPYLLYLYIIFFIYAVLLAFCHSFEDVKTLLAFKEAIYEDPSSVLSNWNILDADPCEWYGVSCSPSKDRVVSINLSNSSLKGFLAPELGYLNSINEIILYKNNFIGTIPKEIGFLKNLTALHLGENLLCGPIPHEFGHLTNIEKIYLESNELIGSIPSEIGNLNKLVELRVDKNKLQGSLPGSEDPIQVNSQVVDKSLIDVNPTGFCRLTHLQAVDFSHNFFVGKKPLCLQKFPRSSFQGNCFQNEDSGLQRSSHECGRTLRDKHHLVNNSETIHTKDGQKHLVLLEPVWLIVVEVITGSFVGLLLAFVFLKVLQKWKSKSSAIISWKKMSSQREHKEVLIDAQMLKHVIKLSRQELEVACEDFSNIIDSFSDSTIYKGTMKSGSEIAVISFYISTGYWTSSLEYCFNNKVADLARINHENTGKLLGYCKESDPFSRMLVFEYASNGTLYEHLHGSEGNQLSWIKRMKIIIGIARGLKYLNTELHPPFAVSELDANSVYLTEDFSPKLVDFERWKAIFVRTGKKSDSGKKGTNIHCGSYSMEMGRYDVQGNIFSFGVLLLEIVSGRPQYSKDKGSLLKWAMQYLEIPEANSNLVDPELQYFNPNDLQVICEVVNLCVQTDSNQSSMQVLWDMLEKGIDISPSAELKASPLSWAEQVLLQT